MYGGDQYWLPSKNPGVLRLINQLTISEETDELQPLGFVGSHFELYLNAMSEVGASTRGISTFVKALREGLGIETALMCAPLPAREFVIGNYEIMQRGVVETAGALFFGREDIVPSLFSKIKCANDFTEHKWFLAYLDRHIEEDVEVHGKIAESIVANLCKDSHENWRRAFFGARTALKLRLALLDSIYCELSASRTEGFHQACYAN